MILDQSIVIFKIPPHCYVSKKQLFWSKKPVSISSGQRKYPARIKFLGRLPCALPGHYESPSFNKK